MLWICQYRSYHAPKTSYNMIESIPSDLPSTDEITAIAEAKKSIEDESVVPFDEIDW